MIELQFDVIQVNTDKLHEDLAAAVGDRFVGVSTKPGTVIVHLEDEASEVDLDTVGPIVQAHDPRGLTKAQRRRVAWDQRRAALRKRWDDWSAGDKDAFLRLLAAEVAGLPVED